MSVPLALVLTWLLLPLPLGLLVGRCLRWSSEGRLAARPVAHAVAPASLAAAA
ncbi:MAG: hypothetical protein JWM64_572 [Frankiales bacterium]|nr:hypothetical protein [Frankiales bacterium]